MLEVQNLSVTARNGAQLLKQISFQIEIGEAVGLTGQSGAGKTTLLKALLGILSGGCQVSGGTIQVDGQSLWALSPRKRRELCGTTLGFIPQNPMTAFDPRLKLGRQMEETLRLRTGVSGKEVVEQAEALLAELGLSQPRRVLDSYPAQLSGGMLQRAAAALLMALHPKYILADEPTSALDAENRTLLLELLEKQGFYDTCVSMKSSTVPTMVAACRLFRQRCDYPLHIGVTETGPVRMGMVKSAMGIGALLLDGIGETVRVSLTADPVQEVYAAREILRAAGLRKDGVNLISCPTCGRTSIDLIGLVEQVDQALRDCEKPITVAVMGCVVNGPGEAREADVGIAGGDGCGVLFVKGQPVQKLPYDQLLPTLLDYIQTL